MFYNIIVVNCKAGEAGMEYWRNGGIEKIEGAEAGARCPCPHWKEGCGEMAKVDARKSK